ncbi:MAG TPA: NAD-glutamate dehydrogenase [Steroidobacteraceae bacterium]|nr:NAD-glutamate dehydrogenase [Steroidobacteraceae bacterium]
MQPRIPAARQHLIDDIAARAKRGSRRDAPVPAQTFAELYYHGVAEEDLSDREVADLAGSARAHLAFGQRRRAGQTLVRVYNPDRDRDGWSSTHTIVEVVTDDMPFLVDSLAIVIGQSGLGVHLTIHPVLQLRRDRAGRIVELDTTGEPRKGFLMESWQRVEIDRQVDPAVFAELEDRIAKALDDVRVAYADWPAMRQRALDICRELEQDPPPLARNETLEGKALLEWMESNHFTFLGYREYRLERGRSHDLLEPVEGTGLGILRDGRGRSSGTATVLTGDIRRHAREKTLLVVTKANSISTVHRATSLDYIGVKLFDARGNVTGERRFLGLFTSSAYNRSPRDIPLLRHKVQRVISHFGLAPASHDGKAVLHVLETYPRDELFQASVPDMIRIVRGIVNLYERQRVRMFVRRDAFRRFYSLLIYAPRDRYNTQVRERMEAIVLEAFHGRTLESQVQLSESNLARVHIIVRTPPEDQRSVDVDAIEERIKAAVRTWQDDLAVALLDRLGEFDGLELSKRYRDAFPAGYQEDVSPTAALDDLEELRAVEADPDHLGMRLLAGSSGRLHFRLFRADAPIILSDALPLLEHMGLIVVSERPYRITVPGQRAIWIQDFELSGRGGELPDPETIAPVFKEAFAAVWSGRAESDGFNRLVLAAGLGWRQTAVLRAYCRYLLQTGIPFSQSYMEQVLSSNLAVATALSRLFEAQFDPELAPGRRERAIASIVARLEEDLEAVKSLDEDRILRAFLSVIRATLRTNRFQVDESGAPKEYLSFKLDSRSLPDLPLPRPLFEIFVYSPRVEGVHLRNGYVARGGIRWSDRREDFRTEILGLMKAQNVKNTVIVPVGAKGGFVPKRLPAGGGREDIQREVVDCYRNFIRGLLDLTDNIVAGQVVAPQRVVRRDTDDAYLVVAADKGTATFSDIANSIAAEYGFWLGDAFASGGSAGYDHKKMGITARGAWESVKRHFRELGVDVQSEDFTTVGIGDMSGDVFGNGMLLSRHIKLKAAFNHLHIFLDPSPDTEASYRERERLFALPRSSWDDYDRKCISRGGGVYSRAQKSIRLSKEAQAMLGVASDSMTPPELIRAILKMDVDLLWNGGIGTYVKASDESNAEVGDRANDAVRVDGGDLRCKVVGEGGNLGLSQRGRIEYAANGGRINTDFIDNSGGVDCSDHEVNIKIALNLASEHADLMTPRRNRLLARMTEEVAELVLRDNYLQTQALSLLETRAPERLNEYAHFIRQLELDGQLDRSLEFLPAGEEIDERRKAGRGLTRPELSVVLSYGKMCLYARLIDSDVPEDPYLSQELDRYFPVPVCRRYGHLLPQHRLRREIIATATTNSLVNRMGPTFARRAQEETGAGAASVARAYTIAREAFSVRDTWAAIEALDNRIAASEQYAMNFATTRLLKFTTYWLIDRHHGRLDIDKQVERLRPGLAELSAALPTALGERLEERFESSRKRLLEHGAPAALAQRIAMLEPLHAGPDIVEVSAAARLEVAATASVYFAIVEALWLDWLHDRIDGLEVSGHWQAVARRTLRDGLFGLERSLCAQAVSEQKSKQPQAVVDGWMSRHRAAIAHARQSIDDMRSLPTTDFATLSVALQSVRRIVES